jgi:hypothetical protein
VGSPIAGGSGGLYSSLPNSDFAESCCLDSHEDAESRGRNEVLWLSSLSSLTMLSCH